jgi:hypothetical protein
LVPFGQGVSEEKICLTLANQKQELLLAVIFVYKASSFGSIRPINMAPRAILFSDWLLLKKSPLKLLGQMGRNFIEDLT